MKIFDSAGFTLLEVLVTMAVSSVLLVVGGDFVVRSTIEANADYYKTLVQADTQTAVNSIARVIRSARSVQANNSQPDPNSPGGAGNLYGWSGAAGVNATLILAVPARDTSGNLLYIDGLHTNLYTNDIVYYFDTASKKLFKRVIANAVAGNAAVTTCPPPLATPSCPADSTIVRDVANLSTNYFDSNNAAVAIPTGTESVNYTLTETKIVGNKSYVGTYSTTVALRNK